MATASMATLHFHRYWPRIQDDLLGRQLSLVIRGKSRFNPHLHTMGKVFSAIFQGLGEFSLSLNLDSVYLIDSLFAAADNNPFPMDSALSFTHQLDKITLWPSLYSSQV